MTDTEGSRLSPEEIRDATPIEVEPADLAPTPIPVRSTRTRSISASAGSGDAFDAYLRTIRDIPLLTPDEANRLADAIRSGEETFREAVVQVPEVADRVVALWNERRAAGRVTGVLCHSYRDDPSKDWSGHVDRHLAKVESLTGRKRRSAKTNAEIARHLTRAHLHLDVLREIDTAVRDAELERASSKAAATRAAPSVRARQEAARRALECRDEARAAFASRNLRLVIKLARRYASMGVSLQDLVQEGNLGLMRAVEKFDPSRGFRFSTYAVWWIEQALVRAVQNQSRTVRTPSHLWDAQIKYRRADQELRARLARAPDASELAAVTGTTEEMIEAVQCSLKPIVSTQQTVGAEMDSTIEDFLTAEEGDPPESETDRDRMREILRRELRLLTPRERRVLELRFGLRSGDPQTLQQIGDEIGLSRERVRQIESSALGRLRGRPNVGKLAEALDGPVALDAAG